jgi:hypothetical protein
MDEAELQSVFEPFSRGDEAVTRRLPGVGLGMYITKGLVENHGGNIRLTSQPGLGTTVWIVLPRDPDSERVLSASRLMATAKAAAGSRELQLAVLDLRRPDRGLDPADAKRAGDIARRFLIRMEEANRARLDRQTDAEVCPPFCTEIAPGLWIGALSARRDLDSEWENAIAGPDRLELLVGSSWELETWPVPVAAPRGGAIALDSAANDQSEVP